MTYNCPPNCALTRNGITHTHHSPLIINGRTHTADCFLFKPVVFRPTNRPPTCNCSGGTS